MHLAPTRHLVLFTRYPEPGQVKTRLIPALGAVGAATLQRQLTQHILQIAQAYAATQGVHLTVSCTGGPVSRMEQVFGAGFTYQPQVEGDLGRRMFMAGAECLEAGYGQVVLIGSDCPGITGASLAGAFKALADHDLVLGPAQDGGYYLIGFRALHPELFQGIAWGTGVVLEETRRRAAALGLQVALLETLTDIDRPEDLPVWEHINNRLHMNNPPALSVIIPALNEAATIQATAHSLGPGEFVEIIVVDGGSADGTPSLARAAGARVLAAPRGRARQQNLGAAAASGDILFFLHADTLAPPGYADFIRQALSLPGVCAGAFSLAISGRLPGLQFMAGVANWRSRWLQLPYGDQGLFVPARLFHRLGGFPDLPIMEDFAFVRQLRHHGRLVTLPVPVLTSGRRWQALGLWRTWYINQAMIWGYSLGVEPSTLARLYRNARPACQARLLTTPARGKN